MIIFYILLTTYTKIFRTYKKVIAIEYQHIQNILLISVVITLALIYFLGIGNKKRILRNLALYIILEKFINNLELLPITFAVFTLILIKEREIKYLRKKSTKQRLLPFIRYLLYLIWKKQLKLLLLFG